MQLQFLKERLKVLEFEVAQNKNGTDNIVKRTKKDVNYLIEDVHERDDCRKYFTLVSFIPLRFTSHGITSNK